MRPRGRSVSPIHRQISFLMGRPVESICGIHVTFESDGARTIIYPNDDMTVADLKNVVLRRLSGGHAHSDEYDLIIDNNILRDRDDLVLRHAGILCGCQVTMMRRPKEVNVRVELASGYATTRVSISSEMKVRRLMAMALRNLGMRETSFHNYIFIYRGITRSTNARLADILGFGPFPEIYPEVELIRARRSFLDDFERDLQEKGDDSSLSDHRQSSAGDDGSLSDHSQSSADSVRWDYP